MVPYLGCNIGCRYCFAHGYTWVKDPKFDYNMDTILKSMEVMNKQTGGDAFCMHGGECTRIKRDDFETILKKMYVLQGKSSVQTNAYDIDNDLIRLFKKYNTSVGVSIDGDGELNALRGFPDNKELTLEYTNRVLENMFEMQKQGIGIGVITLLHKVNASTDDKLDKLLDFILMLRDKGIKGGRLNLMWTNYPEVKQYELTQQEASNAWLYLYGNLKHYPNLQWQPFREFTDNLLGFGHSSCSFGKCDYFCTMGAKVILPDGSLGNCDRTHQEGCTYTRASNNPTYERYEVLKETDCSICRYWNVCYGGCPSEGVNSDWRNKTRWCKPTYDLYNVMEADIRSMFPNIKLVTDYSGTEDYFDMVKRGVYIKAFDKMTWETAHNPSSWRQTKERNDSKPQPRQANKDNGHGDSPHGDFTNQGGKQ